MIPHPLRSLISVPVWKRRWLYYTRAAGPLKYLFDYSNESATFFSTFLLLSSLCFLLGFFCFLLFLLDCGSFLFSFHLSSLFRVQLCPLYKNQLINTSLCKLTMLLEIMNQKIYRMFILLTICMNTVNEKNNIRTLKTFFIVLFFYSTNKIIRWNFCVMSLNWFVSLK